MSEQPDVEVLKKELLGLFSHIQRVRREIASIRRPGESEDHFSRMSDELDAIVQATETATNTIMENVERIEEVVTEVRDGLEDESARGKLDSISGMTGNVFEACTFQDITGQRITKVFKSLKLIEERVNSLIEVWGKDALSHVEPEDAPEETDEYQKYLSGPQLEGQGVSQAEVDAMLDGAPPPEKPAAGKADPTKTSKEEPAPAAVSKPAKKAPAKPEKSSPEKSSPEKPSDDGGGLGQDDIDKLFG